MQNESKPSPPAFKGKPERVYPKRRGWVDAAELPKKDARIESLLEKAKAMKKCECGCGKPAVEDGYYNAKHFAADVEKLDREIKSICRKQGREWLVRDDPKLQKPLYKNQSVVTSK